MSLGFVDPRFCGGFAGVFALDGDKAAARSYALNFGPHAVCGDIEEWAGGKKPVPKADIVIGGPPCQGFSLLNKDRAGDARRALWRPYMVLLARCGALAFVIENVPGLLRSPEYAALTAHAAKLGFDTAAALLNAADYGTPQNRVRAFLFGWKRELDPEKNFPFPPEKTHGRPEDGARFPPCTVKDAIGSLPEPQGTQIRDLPPPLDLHFGRSPTPKSLRRYEAVPPGGNRIDLQKNAPELTPACWLNKRGGTDLFGRLWWDRPSVTIRTEFFKPEKGRYLHPEQHRPITHREAARLMGFTDDFRFYGSKVEIARQIGNAVPPPLAGAVARHIRKLLDKA